MRDIQITYPFGNLSIDELIIAKMFNHFCLEIEDPSCRITDDDRRKTIGLFNNSFESIIIHSYGVNREDDYIEQLSRLANSTSIKSQLTELFSIYPMDVTFKIDEYSLMIEHIENSIEFRNAKEKFGHVIKFI